MMPGKKKNNNGNMFNTDAFLNQVKCKKQSVGSTSEYKLRLSIKFGIFAVHMNLFVVVIV